MAQQHLPKRRNSAAQPGKWWCHGVLPASAGQRKAQEKPGTTLQKFLLELSQVAGNGNLSLHLRKNNHQRNFYCRFSSSGHDADGYAKTWEILQCLVCPGPKRQKTNWKQAQHLVNHIRLGSAALLRGQWLESAQNAGYKMRCAQVWAAALHADPASSTVERNFKAALAIYSRTSLAALISPDLPIELGHDS